MQERSCLAIVLAAGEGKRMRSSRPKVLHEIGGLPMVGHVLRAVLAAGPTRVATVIGPGFDAVAELVRAEAPGARTFVQSERRGTAHAVLAARQAIASGADDILVLFGDSPFVSPGTIGKMRAALAQGAAVVVCGMRPADPAGYGRLILEGERLVAIREEKDASEAERRIGFCNGGIMALDGRHALSILDSVSDDNAQAEFYLTDAVGIANARGLDVRAIEIDADEVFGINSRAQLADAERRFQETRRRAAMDGGATLQAPETVFFSFDTAIGTDVVIEPHVVFGPGVVVEDGAFIRAFCHLEGAQVGRGAIVGPFARLRPGANLGEGARVGNFCEVKNAEIGAGAKVNHLTYIGDASVGEKANIGAGTITCNYDGVAKHRTEIGAGAFIGSNSALVAPVSVGAGAYVASGSVIVEDVSPDALAIARGRQVEKPGWAKARRETRKRAAE